MCSSERSGKTLKPVSHKSAYWALINQSVNQSIKDMRMQVADWTLTSNLQTSYCEGCFGFVGFTSGQPASRNWYLR